MIRKTTIFFLFLALLAIAHAADPENNTDTGTSGVGKSGGDIAKPTLAPEHHEPEKEEKPVSDEKKPTNNTASAAQYAFGASLVLLATL
ncbi:hypothetical protein CAEBREN_11852 [Caenorhabditis brenneri]|uniref:Uncharacterized protein n=1 Tax=Caenorhabditis brenneri TaxID=135651 RepID=G0PC25_CAEBE|nr:hypothetical protein CAEBREN_11852 [Caenorhabditis brenneri]